MSTPTTFQELPLSSKVKAAVEASGYTQPTPIQEQAIPPATEGRDVLGIAQTGTGKTASFVLPMITRLETGRARARMPRSLILAPTRELAAQVAQSFERYGVNHKLNVALLIGGVSMADQIRKLDRGADVLIATPGRLLDHFGRGKVMLMGVDILVIDEADRMLDMGFIPDIEKICKLLPPRRQTLFFSATMPPEITRLVNTFLTDPVRIEVARPATTAKTITQTFHYCENSEDWAKRELLRTLIKDGDVKNAIIFCNRKRDVAILLKSLEKHGFSAGALHGDMDQTNRMKTLDQFRNGEIQMLAASDVAARGLDIPDVSHVFNFDLPWQSDDYVHRIGRTGRAGKQGAAISIVTYDSLNFLSDIEKVTGDAIDWVGEAPTDSDFADAKAKKRRGSGGGRSRGGARGETSARGGDRKNRGRNSERGGRGRGERGRGPKPEAAQNASPDQETQQPAETAAPTTEKTATGDASPRRAPRRRRSRRNRDQTSDAQSAPQQVKTEKTTAPVRPDDTGDRKPRPPKPSGKGNAKPGGSGADGGFADNVPAFLRKPARSASDADS